MRNYKCICDDIENVENYEKAKADNFEGWECHHRLETHTSDGKRRTVDISRKELQALGMYYHRPAEELIFITIPEHSSLHHKGKPSPRKGKRLSEKTKQKMRDSHKGQVAWNKGKTGVNGLQKGKKHNVSEEGRKRMAVNKGKPTWNKGIPCSEGTKRKLSEANKGKHHSEETRKKCSETSKWRHWFNNDEINKFCYECPEGFVPGRLKI